MTKLFMGCVFATSLVGCSSMNYENSMKPPIVPKNQAINTFKMPYYPLRAKWSYPSCIKLKVFKILF